MKIVVTGATGFVGSALVGALRARGDAITVLSRDAARAKAQLGNVTAVAADLQTLGPWAESLAGQDAIVHLAGESIAAKRWDARQRQVLRDSRVEATRTLVEALAALPAERRPRALISASGSDYYTSLGNGLDDDDVTEAEPAGDSFLARLCSDWETEARAAEPLGLRVASMRTGMVLGPGGALAKLTPIFRSFLGGPIGSGRQWQPWIHRDDAVAVYAAATADDRYTGPINLVTGSVRNAELAKQLARSVGRPSWLPVPGFALRTVLGELAEYVLTGRRLVPAKLTVLGFHWSHPTLEDAMADRKAA